MKKSRWICFLTVFAVLVSLPVMGPAVFAADITLPYIQSFTDAKEAAVPVNWSVPGTGKNGTIEVADGLGGKAGDDKSLVLTSTPGTNYYAAPNIPKEDNAVSTDSFVLEANIYLYDKNVNKRILLTTMNASGGNDFFRFCQFRPDGYIGYGADKASNMRYETERWYHVAAVFYKNTAQTNVYDLYINGQKLVNNYAVPAGSKDLTGIRFDIEGVSKGEASKWALDDIRLVSETAVSDETDAAPAAAEDAPVYLRLDHYGNAVQVPSGTTAAQLKASLVLPEGAEAAVCGEDGAVLADTDVAVPGTKLLISAKDGVTVRCFAVNPDPIDLFDADFDSSNFPSDFSGNPIWGGFKFFKCAQDGIALDQVPAACGKTGDKDKAVRITSNVNVDQQIEINPAKPTRGTFVLEGSILAKDYNGARVWQGKAAANDEAYASAWLDNILELKSTGQVYCLGKLTNYKYPLNQWVNYAVEMFAGTNRFVLYINGDKVKEDVFNFKNAKEGQLFDSLSYFKWYQKADVPLTENSETYKTCTTLADEFKIYQGMYDMDAARIGEHADTYQLSIADGVRTMSEIPAGTTASELKRQVTVSEGSSIHIFDADLQAERADGETVTEGDQVVLTAPNGRARRYYTASLKAAELLITKPELYKDNVKTYGFTAGDTLRIQAGVENHRDIPQDAVMIAGLFEDGRLIGVEKAEETGISNTEAIRNLVIEAFAVPPGVDGSKCELRVFLFEDFQSLRPLTDMTPFYHK